MQRLMLKMKDFKNVEMFKVAEIENEFCWVVKID